MGMEEDFKEFKEKVKDEFQKVRKVIDEMNVRISEFEKKITDKGGEKKKDEGWFF